MSNGRQVMPNFNSAPQRGYTPSADVRSLVNQNFGQGTPENRTLNTQVNKMGEGAASQTLQHWVPLQNETKSVVRSYNPLK